jgi:Flavin reductase like domain
VLGLVDPDSDLASGTERTGTAVVALLQWQHRDLAEAFAGAAPAPGGLFRLGTWTETAWGPLLQGVSAWAGIRFGEPGRDVGWSLLLDGVVEHVEVLAEDVPLVHRRGRYVRPETWGTEAR